MSDMPKDAWIQRAKALLFDCQFSLDSRGLIDEARALIEQAGGYDPETECASSDLKFEESLRRVSEKPESQMTQKWLADR